MHTRFANILLIPLALTLTACHNSTPPAPVAPPGSLSPYADIPAADLRETLTSLARAHEQKTELAAWVGTPFLRPVDPPFQPFYANMGKQQSELLKQIRAWAKDHTIDLTFNYSPDTPGRAQKIIEARQEKVVRADDKLNFERDSLIQMYTDYEWQISLLQALLPKTKDPALKAYLEKSLQIHQAGSDEIMSLLKRFKFAG